MCAASTARDHRIDIIRGIALLIISVDHIPGNACAWWTPRAWGFSDMAEVFVFVSGYACGIVYRRRLQSKGLLGCQTKAIRRVVEIYIITVITGCVIVGISSLLGPGGRKDSGFVISLLSLRDLGGNLAILPLYGCLLLVLPAWLSLYARWPNATLALNCVIYVAAQLLPLDVGHTRHWLAYNPFAWQLLFCGGAVISQSQEWRALCVERWWVIGLSLGVVQCAFLVKLAYPDAILPLSAKPTLGALRLLHFTALAVLLVKAAPASDACTTRVLAPLRVCGRNSLITFCAGDTAAQICTPLLVPLAGWRLQVLANVSVCTICIVAALAADGARRVARIRTWRAVTDHADAGG